MKKPILGALGIVGACALCCAIPFAVPFVGALLLSGTGFAMGWDTAICGAIILFGVAGMLVWYRRSVRAKSMACSANGGCGGNPEKQCGT